MANPQLVPFLRLSKEWLHAVQLFGRLNATEWTILMVVAEHTWGRNRATAPIGMASFQERCPKSKVMVWTALKRLSSPAPEGFNLLTRARKATATTETEWALQTDWERWAWPPEELTRMRIILSVYGRDPSEPSIRAWTPDAIEAARFLREHCVRTVATADVPPVDPTNVTWARWCDSMEDLLRRQPLDEVKRVLVWIHDDRHWGPRIQGPQADRRLVRDFDTILAQVGQERIGVRRPRRRNG